MRVLHEPAHGGVALPTRIVAGAYLHTAGLLPATLTAWPSRPRAAPAAPSPPSRFPPTTCSLASVVRRSCPRSSSPPRLRSLPSSHPPRRRLAAVGERGAAAARRSPIPR